MTDQSANVLTVPVTVDLRRVEVIAPNFKQRLSGVTSTIIQLVPLLSGRIGIATLGPGLPDTLPKLRWTQLPGLWRRPTGGVNRVWHARRNVEMLGGLALKGLGAPLTLVFTSASQRRHTSWTKFLIRRMDAVVATSAKTAAYLEVPNTVIMHGIDTSRFAPASAKAAAAAAVGLDASQSYVGCFGRVRRQKGTDLFVNTMIELLPTRPGWSAIIAGRATAEHKAFEAGLKQKVRGAGLEKRILFVGEHTDIERWYQALSLFVAPQRWEGFGLTPLEAMSCGVPVVATDVGAFSELLAQDTGRLIAADDGGAMIEAVADYMTDPQLLARSGENATAHVRQNFPLDREADQLLEIYRRVLGSSA